MVSSAIVLSVWLLGAACAAVARAEDWQFRLVAGSGLPASGKTFGGTWADVDGDGRWDLVLSRHADDLVEFYLGRGDLRFDGPAAVALPPGLLDHHATAACDLDADGDWDLVLTVGADRGQGRSCNQVWRNDGDLALLAVARCEDLLADAAGRGRGALWLRLDASPLPQLLLLNYQSPPRLFGPDAAGVWHDLRERLDAGPDAWWSVAVVEDFDGDGAADLFVAGSERRLLHNRGGRLVAVDAGLLAVAGPEVSAAAAGDADGDGDPDLLLGLRGGALLLLLNESEPGRIRFGGRRGYPDLPPVAEPVSVLMADLDNDGWLDLAVAQRRADRALCAPLLARGTGDGRFIALAAADAGLAAARSRAMGLWAIDLDGDGDLDLVETNGEEPCLRDAVLVYENLALTPGATVELVASPGAAPHGLGALVGLRDARGVRRQKVRCVANPWNASTLPVHFGLGGLAHPGVLEIAWPDGSHQTLPLPSAGGALRVRQDPSALSAAPAGQAP